MSNLPQFRESDSVVAEIVLWAFETGSLPERMNITIKADDVTTFPIAKGTVMAIDSVSGIYAAPYTNGDLKYGTAIGLLDEEIAEDAIGSTPQNVAGIIGIRGTAYEAVVTGLDAAGKADMPTIIFV